MNIQNKDLILQKAFQDGISSSYGSILWSKVFHSIFGIAPHTFGTKIEIDKSHYNLSTIDFDKIREMFPGCYIHHKDILVKKNSNSCVDSNENENEEEFEFISVEAIENGEVESNEISEEPYEYNRGYLFDETYLAATTIIDFKNEVIYRFDSYDFMLYYHDGSNLNGCTPYQVLHKLMDVLPVETNKNQNQFINLVCMNNGEFYTISSKINPVTVDFEKNYNDDFVPVYKEIESFIQSKERKSGLVILNGIPGTGKSMLIRHIITNIPGNYIFVTPNIATHLADPEFMGFLLENKDSVFIMEDCENVIMERNSENSFSSAVSAILNMSDGLMSDIFNAKFICTFNADIKHIDPAILRNGRCIAKYEFGKLNEEKTESLMKELSHELDEYKPMTVADIYNYKAGTKKEEKKVNKPKIGF